MSFKISFKEPATVNEPKKTEIIVALEKIHEATEQGYYSLYSQIRERLIQQLSEEFIKEHGEKVLAGLDMKALANIVTARVARKIGEGM